VKPKDNEEATILIFSDYLEEIGEITQAQEMREDVRNPKTNKWCYEYRFSDNGGNVGIPRVNGITTISTGSRIGAGNSIVGGGNSVGSNVGGSVEGVGN
jgi:hypothetical protein